MCDKMATLAWNIRILRTKRYLLVTECINVGASSRNYLKSFTVSSREIPESNSSSLDAEEKSLIDSLRNVSRMSSNHLKQYHRQPPELPYKDIIHRKKLYALYGSASGEDARILWPSRKQLIDKELEEKEEGCSLFDRLAQIEVEKQERETALKERHKSVEKNMAQMSKWIEGYKKKQEVSANEAKARAAKKEALLEEARDYFGYKIMANDPKFEQMMLEKEEKEKKEAKKMRKEAKLKKQADRLVDSKEKPVESKNT
ncbi:unnamed protein product [Lymnaea stagnalis]|uniref:Large ribosomal subunit protein mL64 n=1 Tax=Lymnaea stagnalis TaxID=6523 RepID=A0AAV2HWA2_LYMST